MKTRRVMLADVAAAAGVSATTASYILNDRGAQMRIAPETDQRVREAARRLGYRPNRSARSLRTRRTATSLSSRWWFTTLTSACAATRRAL